MSRLPPGPAELRRDLFWLAAAAAFLFTISLGARDLWNPNEPVYGQGVAEMARAGSWLVPTVDGEIFAEKPILFFWLARLAALPLGVSELSLRLPSAAAGVAMVVLVYLLVYPYAGRLRARLAAVLLGTIYVVFWTARSVQMDLLLTASILGALVAATRVLDHGLAPRRGWPLAGLAAGLAFLTKGPVGLICIGLVLLVYLAATHRLRELLSPWVPTAAAVCLLVAAPWFLLLWLRGETDVLVEMLYRQNVARFLEPWDHARPWWYFLVHFWLDMAPWALFVPLAWNLPIRDADEQRLDRLAWIWILAPVVFFSLSASKRSPYILPVAPAVAVLVAGLAERLIDGRIEVWRRRASAVLIGSFGVLLLIGAGFVQFSLLDRYLLIGQAGKAAAILLLAGGAAILSGMWISANSRVAPAAALFAFIVSFYFLAAVWILPAVDVYKSPRAFCETIRSYAGDDRPVAAFRIWKWRAGYSYYLGRTIRRLESPDELLDYWSGSDPVYLIVERGMEDEVQSIVGRMQPLSGRSIGSNFAYLYTNRPD